MFTLTAIKKLTMVTAGSVLIALEIGGSAQAVVLTFDNVSGDNIAPIPDGYGGLNWNNFSYANSSWTPAYEGAGYQNGTESGNYVGFNRYGDPGIVKSSSVFNFSSANLTAAWNDGLSITVEGLINGTPRYSNTVVVNTNDSTLFDFNYLGIDELRFNSVGGVNAGFEDIRGREGAQFVVENFTFSLTPTPVTPGTTGVTDPTTGVTDPPTGVTDPTTGVTDPTTGVTDPTTGVTDPTTGVIDPTTGVTDSTTGVIDPTTGVTDPTTGVIDPTTGVIDPTTGVIDPTTGVIDPTTGVIDPTTGVIDPTTPTPIPYEPSSALGLLTLGAFGTGAMLKRKLQQKAKAKNIIYSDIQVEKITQSNPVIDAK